MNPKPTMNTSSRYGSGLPPNMGSSGHGGPPLARITLSITSASGHGAASPTTAPSTVSSSEMITSFLNGFRYGRQRGKIFHWSHAPTVSGVRFFRNGILGLG